MKITIELPENTIAISVTAIQDSGEGELNLNTRVYGTEELKQEAEEE